MADDKWAEYFGGGRHWRIGTEYTGMAEVTGIPVTFAKGHFEIGTDPRGRPGVFASLVSGNWGRRGIVLVEVGPDGHDIRPQVTAAFGDGAVKRARREYKAIW